ncbi:MAG: ribosome maturation factor RimM [Chitinivibrionia bacterium]|nr:ribosome maturation factor RimM [Chitinivibrionia bacterium]
MRINSDDFVAVATIGKPFGLKGACALFAMGETLVNSDFPLKLWAGNAENAREITLLEVSGEGNNIRCVFEDICDRDGADLLKNNILYIEKERLPKLEKDEYYFRDLIGLSVESDECEKIGTIKEAFNYPTTDALDVILNNGRVITIPFKKEIVKKVAVCDGKIIVDSAKIDELMF